MEINITRPNLYPRTCPECPVANKWIEELSKLMKQDEVAMGERAESASINVKCFNLQPHRYYTIHVSLIGKLKFTNSEIKEVNTIAPKLQAICPGLEASLSEGVRRDDVKID